MEVGYFSPKHVYTRKVIEGMAKWLSCCDEEPLLK
jgi:hypothetical protein